MLCFHFGFRSAENKIVFYKFLVNPKNPNLNLDSTDYGCEIRQVSHITPYLEKFLWLPVSYLRK